MSIVNSQALIVQPSASEFSPVEERKAERFSTLVGGPVSWAPRENVANPAISPKRNGGVRMAEQSKKAWTRPEVVKTGSVSDAMVGSDPSLDDG